VQSLQRTPKGLVTFPPKTARSRRRIILSPQAIAILRSHRARQAEQRLSLGPTWQDGDWVFTRCDGRPMSPDALSHNFAAVARSLGLPGTGLHMLRHSHASLLLLQGVNPKVVSERLGHSTVSITLDIYSHVLPGLQEAAAAAFDQAMAVGATNPVANR
jgi:integrase